MGYPVCSNRIHSSGINGPWKSLFETIKSFLGDSHRLKLFLGVWESGVWVIFFDGLDGSTKFHWLFYPALELSIFATFATAEMCTAAADNCTPLLCNKQFGKMHSLSSILTLLLVFLTIVAWKKGPSPTVLRGGQRCGILRGGFLAKPCQKRSLCMSRNV